MDFFSIFNHTYFINKKFEKKKNLNKTNKSSEEVQLLNSKIREYFKENNDAKTDKSLQSELSYSKQEAILFEQLTDANNLSLDEKPKAHKVYSHH